MDIKCVRIHTQTPTNLGKKTACLTGVKNVTWKQGIKPLLLNKPKTFSCFVKERRIDPPCNMLQVKKNNYVHEKYFLCTFSMDLLYFRCSETEKKKYLKVHARVSDNL